MMAATTRTSVLLAAATLAMVALWLGLDRLAARALGPPGFVVAIADAQGRDLNRARVPMLLTPEVAPMPPPGGSLTARATFLAPVAGVYTWQLGGSAPVSLRVDGVLVYAPRPGRVAPHEQHLAAGAHALEVVLAPSDAAGGVAFGVRHPGQRWRSPLIGPGEAVAAPAATVAARLGAHPAVLLGALAWLPGLGTAAVVALGVLALGRARRRRVAAALLALARLPRAPRLATALALVAITLPMIWPLFAPGFFFCGEEESYIVRLSEYAFALDGGVPMGRWFPDPVLGRGYPFLCLYAPLLYILATPSLLAGVSALVTLKLISGALVLAGAVAVYGLARRHGSRPAALLAAALFTYAPYLQTDLWAREDIPETLGFACFPLALWALDRALDAETRAPDGDIARLALALGALGCCHNITAYFSVYFLALWLGLRLAVRSVAPGGLGRVVTGGALGFLLTVFYAVPAIGDARRVWIERVMTGYYNPFRHFVPILSAWWGEPHWDLRLHLGMPATAAVAAGAVALVLRRRGAFVTVRGRGDLAAALRRPRPNRLRLACLAASGVVLAVLLASRVLGWPVFRFVPLAGYVQFPWRMFLFAACLAPLCVPAALDGWAPPAGEATPADTMLPWLRSPRAGWAIAVAGIVALVAVAAPQYGPPAPLVRSRTDVVRFLRGLDIDYVTSMNEYLPKTVRRTVPRFGDVVHVVEGRCGIVSQSRSPGRYDVVAEAAEPATLEFNAHWFPGWRASVDGAAHAIGPGRDGFDDGGLVRVRVPAGRHAVALAFGRTPLRRVCDLVSLAALAAVIALAFRAALARRTA